MPNAFELYGVDFLIEHTRVASENLSFQVKLLEINAEPAIELTGPRLGWILDDLFAAIGTVCILPFLDEKLAEEARKGWELGETRHNLIKCLDEQVRM